MESTDPTPKEYGTVVTRAAQVRIVIDAPEGRSDILLTEEQARAVYSQLRRWYGRNK